MILKKALLFKPLSILLVLCLSGSVIWAQELKRVSKVYDLNGQKQNISALGKKTPLVLLFFSVDCPLCKNYTKTVQELTIKYQGVATIYLVFSGDHQTAEDIRDYQKKYGLSNFVLLDPKLRLANQLKAKITPEAFVIQNDQMVYQGAIDDWVIKLGSTRIEPKEHYLKDALDALLSGKAVEIKKTKAMGCFIQ